MNIQDSSKGIWQRGKHTVRDVKLEEVWKAASGTRTQSNREGGSKLEGESITQRLEASTRRKSKKEEKSEKGGKAWERRLVREKDLTWDKKGNSKAQGKEKACKGSKVLESKHEVHVQDKKHMPDNKTEWQQEGRCAWEREYGWGEDGKRVWESSEVRRTRHQLTMLSSGEAHDRERHGRWKGSKSCAAGKVCEKDEASDREGGSWRKREVRGNWGQ